MTDPTKLMKDAAYITIGAGVILFQKAQVQRQELRKQFESQAGEAREGFEHLSESVDDRLKVLEERLRGLQGQVEEAVGSLPGDIGQRVEALQSQFEEAVTGIEGNVDKYLDDLEARLPEQARTLVAQARSASKEAQGQIRSLVGA
jgi:hypothetical protein